MAFTLAPRPTPAQKPTTQSLWRSARRRSVSAESSQFVDVYDELRRPYPWSNFGTIELLPVLFDRSRDVRRTERKVDEVYLKFRIKSDVEQTHERVRLNRKIDVKRDAFDRVFGERSKENDPTDARVGRTDPLDESIDLFPSINHPFGDGALPRDAPFASSPIRARCYRSELSLVNRHCIVVHFISSVCASHYTTIDMLYSGPIGFSARTRNEPAA